MKAIFSRGGIVSAVFLSSLVIFGSFCANEKTPLAAAKPDQTDVLSGLETNVLDEISPEIEPVEADLNTSYEVAYTYRTPATQTNYVARTNYISILGRTIDIFTSSDTTINAGNRVAQFIRGRYDGRFFYGHNYSNVLGGLAGVPVGSTFSINLDGINRDYQVAYVVTVPNDDALANNMSKIAMAKYGGVSYDIAIMTCAGTPYGDGNATHRTILFAYEY